MSNAVESAAIGDSLRLERLNLYKDFYEIIYPNSIFRRMVN